MTQTSNLLCPCGSGKNYQACCEIYHQGQAAPDPESLMRSRYTAFSGSMWQYLLDTWHSSTRPASLGNDDPVEWFKLEVHESSADSDKGKVSFSATFRQAGKWMQLRENSRFLHENGRWYYVDGDAEWVELDPGRNDPCPCGSGKKFKKCCG
ncbi:zinc chelation protein SecC [Hahella sp. CCB-MM4]|nr:YchJ family metal-binding protein [Hahella sp. CCB-MM4]OZG72027.1 zinc chelation protein SecC [Hahella sp. CCB-MM4]